MVHMSETNMVNMHLYRMLERAENSFFTEEDAEREAFEIGMKGRMSDHFSKHPSIHPSRNPSRGGNHPQNLNLSVNASYGPTGTASPSRHPKSQTMTGGMPGLGNNGNNLSSAVGDFNQKSRAQTTCQISMPVAKNKFTEEKSQASADLKQQRREKHRKMMERMGM